MNAIKQRQQLAQITAQLQLGLPVRRLLEESQPVELILRAYVEALGTVSHPEQEELRVSLLVSQAQALEVNGIWPEASVSSEGDHQRLSWFGLIALDLLGSAFESSDAELADSSHAITYRHWCSKVSLFEASSTVGRSVRQQSSGRGAEMRVKKLLPEAVVPSKQRISDSGYDVTLLYEKKRMGNVVLYGTGIVVEAPFGWYFDVVPRSSIIKLGYILANSVGVIDRTYRGELFVPLIKSDAKALELDLPQRVVQLIPRPIVHFPVVEVEDLSQSLRGERGFGSSGR